MREHQQKAFNRAITQNLLVFYEQGLGKTLIGVELVKARINLGHTLIVTKKSLLNQWKEALDCQLKGLSVHRNLTLTSYSQLKNLKRKTYKTLILDESHLVKNRNTQRFKLIKSLKADRKLFLTATPLDYRLSEVFWQLHLLEPKTFMMSVFKYILNAENDSLPLNHRQELQKRWILKFSPYIIKAEMSDHNKKAKLKLVIHRLNMSPEQRDLYTAFQRSRDVYLVYKKTLWVLPNNFTKNLRLRQISTWPQELNNSAVKPLSQPLLGLTSPKVDWVEHFLSDPQRRKTTLVYSTIRSVVNYLADKYNVKPNKKNPDGLCVGTLAGMATGIDLPNHEHTIIMDGDYSRILNSQATTRFMRLTSTGVKTVHYLIISEIDYKLLIEIQNKNSKLDLYNTEWRK